MQTSKALSGFFLGLTLVLAQSAKAHDGSAEQALKAAQTGGCEEHVAKSWNGRHLILDTNILLEDPMAIHKFPGAHIVITGTVLEEIDGKKGDQANPHLAYAARKFSRTIWEIMQKHEGNENIPIGEGSTLTLDFTDYGKELKGSVTLDMQKKDNEILASVKAYASKHGDGKVTLLSNDINVLIKSRGLKIDARKSDLQGGRVTPHDSKKEQMKELEITDAEMKGFKVGGIVRKPVGFDVAPNEFVMLKSPSTPPDEANVVRYKYQREETDPEKQFLHMLPTFEGLPFKPLNIEQKMALDVLMDPDVRLVILDAKAGTGKTFLTMLAAYTMYKAGVFREILVSKPAVHIGADPGALPGDMGEKYEPWMQPYIDNLSQIIAGPKATADERKKTKRLEDLPKGFDILPFAFLRGRTLPDVMVIIDEYQNATEHEAKTILTRVGEGTKIVVIGDPSQIDIPPSHMNPAANALSRTGARMLNPKFNLVQRSLSARVKLHNGVRSELAELASVAFEQSIPLD